MVFIGRKKYFCELYNLIIHLLEIKFNNIILNQRQYSDKDVFNKLNFNIEKIINEKKLI